MGFVRDAFNAITGKTGAKAAKEAGRLQSNAALQAGQISQQQYDQTRADNMPWLNAGQAGLTGLQGFINDPKNNYNDRLGKMLNKSLGSMGFNDGSFGGSVGASSIGNFGNIEAGTVRARQYQDRMKAGIQANYDAGEYTGGLSLDDFEVDPGYEFRKAEGNAGVQSSAAASGSLLSGAALKSLNRYNSDLASQEYNTAWGRDQSQKQQKFGVDTGLRAQDHAIFADGANRNLAADSQNVNSYLSASTSNANLNQQSASTNAQLSQNAEIANQNYGLNALGVLMGARQQDYGIYGQESDRKYGQFAGLANMGLSAANGLGQFGAQNSANVGNSYINSSNAQANGLVGAANAQSQGWGNIFNMGLTAAGVGGFGKK